MRIKVNGESHECDAGMNVQALAELLQLNLRQVAIERNRAIVPRSAYDDVPLMDGDEIEILAFIGGG